MNIDPLRKPLWNNEYGQTFFAPELLEDGHDFDEKIDVWALGVTSWKILSNSYP